MSRAYKDLSTVTRYIRKLRGGSQPILVQASDGSIYVAKFVNNLQGPNLVFNEAAGHELYQACGLAVPSWTPLLLTDEFIDSNPDCWMETAEGRQRPAAGLCFGSRYLAAGSQRMLEILPGTSFGRISNRNSFWLAWIVDICAQHADNRQALFAEDARGMLDAFFIDHGHLFGGASGQGPRHFIASRYLDPRVYPSVSLQYFVSVRKSLASIDIDDLWQTVLELPQEWKTPTALDNFAKCLTNLSTSCLLKGIVDTILDSQLRTPGSEFSDNRRRPKPPASVLCACVPAAGVGLQRVANERHHSLCA